MHDKSKKLITSNEVDELLHHLLLQVQSTLSEKFVGMYIGGSIANNNFDDETSDIDVYVVTTTTLSESMLHQIETIHKNFYSGKIPYAKKIETFYVQINDFLNFDPKSIWPYFNEGYFYLAHSDSQLSRRFNREKIERISMNHTPDLLNPIKPLFQLAHG